MVSILDVCSKTYTIQNKPRIISTNKTNYVIMLIYACYIHGTCITFWIMYRAILYMSINRYSTYYFNNKVVRVYRNAICYIHIKCYIVRFICYYYHYVLKGNVFNKTNKKYTFKTIHGTRTIELFIKTVLSRKKIYSENVPLYIDLLWIVPFLFFPLFATRLDTGIVTFCHFTCQFIRIMNVDCGFNSAKSTSIAFNDSFERVLMLSIITRKLLLKQDRPLMMSMFACFNWIPKGASNRDYPKIRTSTKSAEIGSWCFASIQSRVFLIKHLTRYRVKNIS